MEEEIDNLSNLFNIVSTKTQYEEYDHLENIIKKFKFIKDKDDIELLNFLSEVDYLLKRYKDTFYDNMNFVIEKDNSLKIKEATEIYFKNHKILKDAPSKEQAYLLVNIGLIIFNFIRDEVNKFYEDEEMEDYNYDYDCDY